MNDSPKLTTKQLEALRYIRNCLVHEGKTPSIRDVMRALNFKSPRSAHIIIDDLIEIGLLKRRDDNSIRLMRDLSEKNDNARTVDVPLVGAVSCGMPILAEENIEAYFPVSTQLAKPNHKYFLLRACGDSMNKAGIKDSDLVLIQQQSAAEAGDRIVALIDDEATIKVFKKTDQAVILQPKSTNPDHKPIILTSNFKVQGVVKAVLPSDL